jgi:hypothetical protein
MNTNRVGPASQGKNNQPATTLQRVLDQASRDKQKTSSPAARGTGRGGAAPEASQAARVAGERKVSARQSDKGPITNGSTPKPIQQTKPANTNPLNQFGSAIQNFFMPKAQAMTLDGNGAAATTGASKPDATPASAGTSAKPSSEPVATAKTQPANTTNQTKTDQPKTFLDYMGGALPDAGVITNNWARSQPNSKNFALVNITNGKTTQFINHPQNKTTVGGVPLTRVEAIQYDPVGGSGTRREDGLGYTTPIGSDKKSTFFINFRGGDTNVNNSVNGASVNVGFFGPVPNMQKLVNKLPSTGKAGAVKTALETSMNSASATGVQVGFAWSGKVTHNAKTNKVELDLSGFKIPLADLTKAVKTESASITNEQKKTIAQANNQEAYTNGANPFTRADETRDKNGAYLNHGDTVASIAGDVRNWQNKLEGTQAKPVQSNADAARVLETGIEKSAAMSPQDAKKWKNVEGAETLNVRNDALSNSEKSSLERTLAKLDKTGTYFGSEKVKTAAQQASKNLGDTVKVKPEDAAFTRQVFNGKFRKEAVHQYNFGDGVRDVALGVNRWTAVVTTLFNAAPVADGTLPRDKMAAESKGFAARMGSQGSTSQQLGLKPAGNKVDPATDAKATDALNTVMSRRLMFAGKPANAQARVEAFKALTPAERKVVADEVQSTLNRS